MLGNVDQYAWAFGDLVRDLVRDAISLRYRLMPYIYTAFVAAAQTGEPVQRPLVLDHQHDPLVRDLDDQYLFGTDLLVAPVTEPGMTSRQVYLPAGDWYDWHTDELVHGTRFVIAATPMDRIPLYARAGAAIPMWPEAPPSTRGYHPRVIELHVFVPPADATHRSRLAEDDGLTFAARDGSCYRTEITLTRTGSRVALTAAVTGEGYPEFRRESFLVVMHGATPAALHADGTDIPRGDRGFVLPNHGSGFAAAFDV
jgi:alpha-glucosidase